MAKLYDDNPQITISRNWSSYILSERLSLRVAVGHGSSGLVVPLYEDEV